MFNCKDLVIAAATLGITAVLPTFADEVSSSTSVSSDSAGVSKTSTSEVDVQNKPVAPAEISTQSSKLSTVKSSHCSMKTMTEQPKSVSTTTSTMSSTAH